MMSVRESNALNTLFNFLFNRRGADEKPISPVHARDAAEVLAHGANRTLMAGWRPEQVRSEWSAAPLLPRRREAKR